MVMFEQFKFLPALFYQCLELTHRLLTECLVPINCRKSQERISRSDGEFLSSCCFKFSCKAGINGAEIQLVIV